MNKYSNKDLETAAIQMIDVSDYLIAREAPEEVLRSARHIMHYLTGVVRKETQDA